MKLSDIITKLQLAKKFYGNIDVCFSSDEEGNDIRDTADLSLYEKEDGTAVVCLYPYQSR